MKSVALMLCLVLWPVTVAAQEDVFTKGKIISWTEEERTKAVSIPASSYGSGVTTPARVANTHHKFFVFEIAAENVAYKCESKKKDFRLDQEIEFRAETRGSDDAVKHLFVRSVAGGERKYRVVGLRKLNGN